MTTQAESAPAVPKSGLFARTATGLVRGVPPRSSLIINFIPGHPTQTMAAILLFALAVGPGGNPYLALLIVVPMSLSFAYAFGFLTQMIPRSGGDYMLVSRVVHPAVGYVSVFTMTMAGLLSNAFFGLAVVLVELPRASPRRRVRVRAGDHLVTAEPDDAVVAGPDVLR